MSTPILHFSTHCWTPRDSAPDSLPNCVTWYHRITHFLIVVLNWEASEGVHGSSNLYDHLYLQRIMFCMLVVRLTRLDMGSIFFKGVIFVSMHSSFVVLAIAADGCLAWIWFVFLFALSPCCPMLHVCFYAEGCLAAWVVTVVWFWGALCLLGERILAELPLTAELVVAKNVYESTSHSRMTAHSLDLEGLG